MLTKWTSIQYNTAKILREITTSPDSGEVNAHAHYYPCSVYQAVFFTHPSSVRRICKKYGAGEEANNSHIQECHIPVHGGVEGV